VGTRGGDSNNDAANANAKVHGSNAAGDSTVHVLTAYELSACPPLPVTPLHFEPKGGGGGRGDAGGLGAKLWWGAVQVEQVESS
jgi:hypothetical protein